MSLRMAHLGHTGTRPSDEACPAAFRIRRDGLRPRRENIPRREAKGTIRPGRMVATRMAATRMAAIEAIARRRTVVDTRRLLRVATVTMEARTEAMATRRLHVATVPTVARTGATATRRRRHIVTVEEDSPGTAVPVITAQVEARVRTADTSAVKLHSHHGTPSATAGGVFLCSRMTVYTASLDSRRLE